MYVLFAVSESRLREVGYILRKHEQTFQFSPLLGRVRGIWRPESQFALTKVTQRV